MIKNAGSETNVSADEEYNNRFLLIWTLVTTDKRKCRH